MEDLNDMVTPALLLVGAGQLGSRYLQGLARVNQQLSITVVDPSSASLDVARQRLAEVTQATRHEVNFTSLLEEAPRQLDLALVVTPAHCRSDVVSAITAQHEVDAWILEKVLAQSAQQVEQIERCLTGQSQVWVNTPRRLMAWHQAIKEKVLPSSPEALQVRMSGGHWGLACNAIHFIDLVSWWTGASVDGVDGSELGLAAQQAPWLSGGVRYARRYFRDGSSLELSCRQSDVPPRIEVETPEGIWLIEEAAGKPLGLGQVIAASSAFRVPSPLPSWSRFSPPGAAICPASLIQPPSTAHSWIPCSSTGTTANPAKTWSYRSLDFPWLPLSG